MKYTKEDFLLEKSEKPEWKDVQWEDVDPLQEAKRKQAIEERIQELEDMYPNGGVDDYDMYDQICEQGLSPKDLSPYDTVLSDTVNAHLPDCSFSLVLLFDEQKQVKKPPL